MDIDPKEKIQLVEEPYTGIQGEGINVGLPMTFIRIQGCPVGCTWCDTKQSWAQNNGNEYTFEEIGNYILDLGVAHIWFTGGEPTVDIKKLKRLIGYVKELEIQEETVITCYVCTAGVNMDQELLGLAHITLDVKSSGIASMPTSIDMMNKIYVHNSYYAEKRHEFKIVAGYADGEAIRKMADKYPNIPITVQPIYPMNGRPLEHDDTKMRGQEKRYDISQKEMSEFTEWYLENFGVYGSLKNVRLGFQLHKHLYPYRGTGI